MNTKKFRNYLLITLFTLPLLSFSAKIKPTTPPIPEHVIRAAIDIGSGATKLKVAKINLKTQKIDQVLVNESFSVQYHEELEKSPDGVFNETVMQTGLEALKKSLKIAQHHQAEKVVAVATASFRKAANVQEFIDKIYAETGIQIYIIDQHLEGVLGFQATTAQLPTDPKNVVVWDIGGGSYQLTTLDQKGEIVVHRGLDASIPNRVKTCNFERVKAQRFDDRKRVSIIQYKPFCDRRIPGALTQLKIASFNPVGYIPFKNHVIKEIKKENLNTVSTPNPLSRLQLYHAQNHAVDLSKKIGDIFKQKIYQPQTKVVGIGNIFAYGVHPLVDKKSTFTQKDLHEKIQQLEGKKDRDLGSGAYVNVAVTNPVLVLGFMQTLGIHEMGIIDVNNADGALLYPAFWDKS